jgi:hypothetical protein
MRQFNLSAQSPKNVSDKKVIGRFSGDFVTGDRQMINSHSGSLPCIPALLPTSNTPNTSTTKNRLADPE